jgi:hypothetical protein
MRLTPSFLFELIGGWVLVEWVGFLSAPVLLSRLAVTPVETRVLDVPSRALGASAAGETGGAPGQTPYRAPAAPSFDLARLASRAREKTSDATLFFFARPARVVAVSNFDHARRKARALVRVDLAERDGRVALRARCYPAGIWFTLAFLWPVLEERSVRAAVVCLFVALLAAAVIIRVDRLFARRLVDAVADEVSRRLELLAQGEARSAP